MLASLLIFIFAVVLLLYWFRYTCELALQTKKEAACIARVAAVNGLTFLSVQARLQKGETAMLDGLCESLDEDYRVLRYLLRNSVGRRQLSSIEQEMLLCDYFVMRIWYRCARRFWQRRAVKALEERSQILGSLAHQMAQRGDSHATA